MNKKTYSYKTKALILFSLGWEILFWILLFFTLYALGFFGNQTNVYIDFEYPRYFLLIPFTMIITLVFIFNVYNHNSLYKDTGKFADKTIMRPTQNTNLFIRYFLFKNTITFLLIALAQPAIGVKSYSTLAENTHVLLAIDASNSMNTRDINQESRLNIAKRAAIAFTKQLSDEQIGIVLFANEAIDYLPFTNDYYAARTYIEDIETSLLTNQGSNINQLLSKVSSTFPSIDGVNNKLIILTDGEFHEKLEYDVKSALMEKNIQSAVIGIGTEYGGFIPNDPTAPEQGFKTSFMGTTIISKVDKNIIHRLAKELKGFSSIVSTPFPDLNKVYIQLKEIQSSENNELFIAKDQKYTVPLLIAMLSFIIYLFWNGKIIITLDDFLTKK